jgi:hypothetical protein
MCEDFVDANGNWHSIDELLNYAIEIIALREQLDGLKQVEAYADELFNDCNRFMNERDILRKQLEIYLDMSDKLSNWVEAYPLEVWEEPDWNKVKELLGDHLLSCISASNMRHVITQVGKIVKNALAEIAGNSI